MVNNTATIALDAMGGDFGPEVVVPAALRALDLDPQLSVILVGNEDEIQSRLKSKNARPDPRIQVRHSTQVVDMDEPAANALRGKKDSSMRVAINLVKSGEAQACVSAGNTGALMATARFVLKTLAGIDRPAICKILPAVDGHTYALDLGANVDSSADHLFQFAVMGSVLASAIDSNPNPRVGLLNIGAEEIKGNEQVKEAAKVLSGSQLNYIGFVEGDGIFLGDADVVVCDGFVGNVMLKTAEGVAKMFSHFLKQAYTHNLYGRVAALISAPVLKMLKKRVDPREYNGASLLGLKGIVIKSHGGADEKAYAAAIHEAVLEAKMDVPRLISEQLGSLLLKEKTA